MTAYGKRTDFTGLVLQTIVDEEFGQGVNIPVVLARAEFCDMCDPGDPDAFDAGDGFAPNCAAEYTVAASTVLGMAGHDVHYCQEHMQVMLSRSPDIWKARA